MNLDCNSNMSAIKINSNSMASALIIQQRPVSIFKSYSTFSYLEQRFILAICKHRIIFCHWFVAKTSKYTEHLLEVLIITLQASVLKVIRIFLNQPVDNDSLVILNIIITLITCKSNWLILINRNTIIPKTREN